MRDPNCKHEMDPATKEFVAGVGYRGVCKFCGAKLTMMRIRHPKNEPNTRVRMSKKERKRIGRTGK